MSDSERISRILTLVGPALLLAWPSGSKGDRRKWGHLQLTDMDDEGHRSKLERAGNIGVALGTVSGNLVTIDLDHDTYVEAFLAANPPLTGTLRTTAVRGCNIWLRCNGDYPRSRKLKDQHGTEIGEFRADGNQTIISGTHPEGVLYRFAVEKPAITISYEAIAWPDTILPPSAATESKRVRGVRETEVVSVCVYEAGLSLERVGDLISRVAPKAVHQNNASLFKLARLLVDYANAIGRPANDAERLLVFDRWCHAARPFWRQGLTREDYWTEFLQACHYARFGLEQNPLELAIYRARKKPLPAVTGYNDERVRLLAGICGEMHELVGGNVFYVPTRQAGELLDAHCSSVARWLVAFEGLGLIHLAPGEVRYKPGRERSPRYHYGSRADCLICGNPDALPVEGNMSQFQPLALTDGQSSTTA